MKKIVFALTFAIALSVVINIYAQDKCTISGEVLYSGESNIYVLLLNSKTFPAAAGRKKEMPPPGFVQIVKAGASGKASFAFKNIPKGEYIVRVFADENNNGKFDCDAWGFPLEPMKSYKPSADGIQSNWYEQKFAADKDITDIMVKLRD
jgi:uncharacterized protein (DUF2141 family)